MALFYALIAAIIISLASVLGAIPLLLKKKIPRKALLILLSISVGAILATVLVNFLPEAFEHDHSSYGVPLLVLAGFLVMFLVERVVHHHHSDKEHAVAHSHTYSLAPVNLIGDAVHNFIDGLVLVASFAVSPALGIAASISVFLHELPQEIADFGILLYAGFSKKRALYFNLFSASMAIVGVLLGAFLLDKSHGFSEFMIPFAAGNFIYIAASNLIPQLHKNCSIKEDIGHVLAIILGAAIIIGIGMIAPMHAHG